MKLATDDLEGLTGSADALGVATDCADAVVGIGAAIRNTDGDDEVEIGGPTLVYTRKVLQRAIELTATAPGPAPAAAATHQAPPAACKNN